MDTIPIQITNVANGKCKANQLVRRQVAVAAEQDVLGVLDVVAVREVASISLRPVGRGADHFDGDVVVLEAFDAGDGQRFLHVLLPREVEFAAGPGHQDVCDAVVVAPDRVVADARDAAVAGVLGEDELVRLDDHDLLLVPEVIDHGAREAGDDAVGQGVDGSFLCKGAAFEDLGQAVLVVLDVVVSGLFWFFGQDLDAPFFNGVDQVPDGICELVIDFGVGLKGLGAIVWQLVLFHLSSRNGIHDILNRVCNYSIQR